MISLRTNDSQVKEQDPDSLSSEHRSLSTADKPVLDVPSSGQQASHWEAWVLRVWVMKPSRGKASYLLYGMYLCARECVCACA